VWDVQHGVNTVRTVPSRLPPLTVPAVQYNKGPWKSLKVIGNVALRPTTYQWVSKPGCYTGKKARILTLFKAGACPFTFCISYCTGNVVDTKIYSQSPRYWYLLTLVVLCKTCSFCSVNLSCSRNALLIIIILLLFITPEAVHRPNIVTKITCTAWHQSTSPSCAFRLRMLPDDVNYVLLAEDFWIFLATTWCQTMVDVRSVSPVLTSGTHFLSISGNQHQ